MTIVPARWTNARACRRNALTIGLVGVATNVALYVLTIELGELAGCQGSDAPGQVARSS